MSICVLCNKSELYEVDAVFDTTGVELPEPPYAPLAPSGACSECGEMTMATRMVEKDGRHLCIPCAEAK